MAWKKRNTSGPSAPAGGRRPEVRHPEPVLQRAEEGEVREAVEARQRKGTGFFSKRRSATFRPTGMHRSNMKRLKEWCP